jgi:hypothetical protein
MANAAHVSNASAMIPDPRYRALFVGAGAQMLCGVGQFTHRLRETIEQREPGSTATLTLTRTQGSPGAIWRAVGSARAVVCNLPLVPWKRVIVSPLLAMAIARLRGRRLILIQHEWGSLHWLRRLTYLPALLMADAIVMFSPLVRRELADDRLAGLAARKVRLAPLPPNMAMPPNLADSELRQLLAEVRAQGRLVIGHFGSIYPGKQPNALLAICARLAARGHKPLVVYIGSFIRGMDKVEEMFFARAAELRVADDVIVTGFVDSNDELFGLFGKVDAFCYPLDEGLTARRSSILACVQSGRPVIVTEPLDTHEFDHHPRFKALIDRGAIVLVPRGASEDVYANMIAAALKRPQSQVAFDFDGWWRDAADAVRGQYTVSPVAGTAPGNAAQTPRAGR